MPVLLLLLVGGGGLAVALRRGRKKPRKAAAGGGESLKKLSQPSDTLQKLANAAGPEFGAGLAALKISSDIETAVVKATGGNQAQQDFAKVAGYAGSTVGPGVAAGLAVRNVVAGPVSKALGIKDPQASNQIGQIAGLVTSAASIAGPQGVVVALAAKGLGEGASALEGLVLGQQKMAQTRQWVHDLDPTASGTAGARLASKLSSLFGGGPKATKLTPAQIAASQRLARKNLAVAKATAAKNPGTPINIPGAFGGITITYGKK